jgi:hypothetical protein
VIGHDEVEELAVRAPPPPPEFVIGKSIDPDSGPSELFLQVVSVVVGDGPCAADVEKHSVSSVLKKISDDELLSVLGIEVLLAAEDIPVVLNCGGSFARRWPALHERQRRCAQ